MLTPHRSTAAAPRGRAVVLAAVLVLGATAGCTSPGPAPDASPSASATRPSRADATDAPSSSSAAATDPTAAATGSTDGGAAGALASEILPSQAPGPAGLPDVAPPAAGPSLTGPLPATGASNGSVVKGFPKEVVPIVDGLTVVSSSVSASGDRLQVGLQASSDAAPADVQAAYVAALGGAGFAVSDSPSLPGTTATAFTRGPDGLVLTTSDRIGGGTELSIAGTLTTAG
ncbi:hypothetical protein [Cellulomonas sp. P5_E12]